MCGLDRGRNLTDSQRRGVFHLRVLNGGTVHDFETHISSAAARRHQARIVASVIVSLVDETADAVNEVGV